MDGFAGLDALPWGSVEHAYGPADDIPELIRAAVGSWSAVGELSVRLHHQGGSVYPAAPVALPFLVTLAAEPAVVARASVVELIGDIARAARTAEPRLVDSAWPAAWARALPRLLVLLADSDPAVRRRIGYPLAQAVADAATVWKSISPRWRAEDDRAARLGLVATVGQLLRNGAGWNGTAARRWLAGLRTAADPAVRLAALLALRRAGTRESAELVLAVLRETDLSPWAETWWGHAHPRGMIARIDRGWGDDPRGRTLLATTLLDHPDPAYRAGALRAAAEVAGRWRSPVADLLPPVAARLADPDPGNRAFAARLLAACGTRAAAWADRLAEACADPDPGTATFAVYALTRTGDDRCLAPLAERLTTFALDSHSGGGWANLPPGIVEVLGDRPHYAEHLLPGIRARLRSATTIEERRAFARVLAAWGPAAEPAVEELASLLDTDAAAWALTALAAIGPAALRAVPVERIRGKRPEAVTAYWRLTGDPGPALDLLLPLLDDQIRAFPAFDFLAELGPAAHPYADRVRAVLAGLGVSGLTAPAARALWRITGDPTAAIAVSTAQVRRVAQGEPVVPAILRAVTTLGEIGPPAAAAVPVLRRAVVGDRRATSPGEWTSIPLDEEFRSATDVAVRRIRSAR